MSVFAFDKLFYNSDKLKIILITYFLKKQLFEPLGIDGTSFGILSSIEKARIFLEKTEEKVVEISQLSLEKQTSKRSKNNK